MTKTHERCADLLFCIYRDWDVALLPQSLRVKKWEFFQNRVRAAAQQSVHLRSFVEKLSAHLDIKSLSDGRILCLISEGDDDECLRLFREETKLLTLMVRQKDADLKEAKNAKTNRKN